MVTKELDKLMNKNQDASEYRRWLLLEQNQLEKAKKLTGIAIKTINIQSIGYLGFSNINHIGAMGLVVEERGGFIDRHVFKAVLDISYKSGFFYHHVKPLVDNLSKINLTEIDLLIIPGHGTLHPRGFGLACEIADQVDIPVVGVARELIHNVDDFTSEEEYISSFGGIKLSSSKGSPVYISTGGNCSINRLSHLIIKRLNPNGWLNGLQLARSLARRALRK
ncbi:MAG: endonuclease V [Candidatus Hodarchaeales archaeon]|jgi:deoxyinosine 3'endonuclease (endonuclease V)